MRWPVLLVLCALLAGCDGFLGILPAPTVAANVQAGRTNAQTIGSTMITDQRIEAGQAGVIEQSAGETGVRGQRIETVVVRQDPPPWLLLVALLGWLLPTPQQIGVALFSLISQIFRGAFRGSLPGG